MTITVYIASSSAMTPGALKNEEPTADVQPSTRPQDIDLATLVAALTFDEAPAVTFDQIEAAMVAAGHNPFEASDLYQAIVETLERRQILVVETLERDQQWIDEDTAAKALADEVWIMLKHARLPLDEYKHPILSADRERRLLEIYREGKRAQQEIVSELSRSQRRSAERRIESGIQALDELMRCNLRLVTQVAIRYARRVQHLSLDDLIQEGRIGLYKAIERYDLSLNLRLSTYATWWIRQSIDRAVADNERTIRLPVHLQETLHRLKQERERWIALRGVEATDEELADRLGISVKKVQLLRTVDYQAISLDASIGNTHDIVLGDLIPDLTEYEPSQLADQRAIKAALQSVLNKLSDRERRVIALRFGLIDGEERTLESIGREEGVTRERIRQIEIKALKRLQHPRVKRFLQDFLS